jgi:hypothetical protein
MALVYEYMQGGNLQQKLRGDYNRSQSACFVKVDNNELLLNKEFEINIFNDIQQKMAESLLPGSRDFELHMNLH